MPNEPSVVTPGPPDFVILGAMKAATTSLLSWLCDYDEVARPAEKEPNFFCWPEEWEQGFDHYASNFPRRPGQISGEASVRYLDPRYAPTVAERISGHLPDLRLLAVLRDPVGRLKSHYRHEVRMGRERRPFKSAVTIDSTYVRRSLYGRGLQPFVATPNPLLVVRYEDLVSPSHRAWAQVTDFLRLPRCPHPGRVENKTSSKAQYTVVLRRILDSPLADMLLALPRPLRLLGRPLLFRDQWDRDPRYSISDDVAPEIRALLGEDERLLADLLGWERPIWTSSAEGV